MVLILVILLIKPAFLSMSTLRWSLKTLSTELSSDKVTMSKPSSLMRNSMYSSLKSLLSSRHKRQDPTHLQLLRMISMNLKVLPLLLVPHQLKHQTQMSSSTNPQTQETLELPTSQVISLPAQLLLPMISLHLRLHLAPMALHSEA